MNRSTTPLATLLVMLVGTPLFGDITLVVHNDIASPDLWIYMNCASSTDLNLANQQYVQPWKGQKPKDVQPYKVTFKYINSGNLSFGLMGPQSESYLDPDDPLYNDPVAPNSDSFYGFIEFTYLDTDKQATWDLSNVDAVGMLCGMTCSDPAFIKCGYNTASQPSFLQGILAASGLTESSPAYVKSGPKLAYGKVLSPTILPSAYQNVMGNYLTQLEKMRIRVELWSDDLTNYSTCGIPIGGPPSAEFSGTFHPAKTVNGINDVVLKLAGQDAAQTTIYLTTTALNGTTVFAADSDGGVFVYQGTKLVGDNVHLNWGTPCGDVPKQPTAAQKKMLALQAEVSSVIRNLLTAMNTGEIPYSKPGQVYNQQNQNTWVPAYTGKYSNLYNQYVVTNSNSYGMPYSDAAHSKVQYFSSGNATVHLHLLGPNDPKTKNYYNTGQ